MSALVLIATAIYVPSALVLIVAIRREMGREFDVLADDAPTLPGALGRPLSPEMEARLAEVFPPWDEAVATLRVGAEPPYSVTYIARALVGGGIDRWFVMGTVGGDPRDQCGPVAICEYEPSAHVIAALLNASGGCVNPEVAP